MFRYLYVHLAHPPCRRIPMLLQILGALRGGAEFDIIAQNKPVTTKIGIERLLKDPLRSGTAIKINCVNI